MERQFCTRDCISRFCVSACPSNALRAGDKAVLVRLDRCYRCGLCRDLCFVFRTQNRRNVDSVPSIPAREEAAPKIPVRV